MSVGDVPEYDVSDAPGPGQGVPTDGPFFRDGDGWMSDSELISVVQTEIDSSLGWTGTRLAEARRTTLASYFGNPRGDEREGRSQVNTREIFEQVEWALPPLMEVFTSSNEVVRFVPERKEDSEAADQATDACNWVFRRANGFMVLHTMFKDALIQKNGIVKVWWEDSSEGAIEVYEGKTIYEVIALVEDENFTFKEATAYVEEDNERRDLEDPQEIEQIANANAQGQGPDLYYDVRGVRTNASGRVVIDNIPPEEFIINRDARGLHDDTCRFVGHRIRTSESQLLAWGYPEDVVKRLPGSQSVYTTDQDSIIRASQDDSFPLVFGYRNDSERTIYVTECFVLVDRDGDGISEWWRVMAGGDYGQALLEAKPVDGHPFASVTPIPIPHRFYGLSIADVNIDIQEINTTLWRQLLDSLYLCTDPRWKVLTPGGDESGAPGANLEQLLSPVPGGYVEEYVPNAISPLETRDASAHILPAFEVHNQMKERRTGISPEAMGIDPDSISKHVYGAMVQQRGAANRITLFARIFADTGVKDIFKLIYKNLLQHQTKKMMVRLRGEWKEVDPASWSHGMDCTVTVGLGHGSRMEKASGHQIIGEVQKQMLEAGLVNIVNVENLYNSAVGLCETLGFKDVDKYFTNPSTVPPPVPQKSEAEMAVEMQQQVEFMKLEVDRQRVEVDRYKVMFDFKIKEMTHELAVVKAKSMMDEGKQGPIPEETPFDDPWTMITPDSIPPADEMVVPTVRPEQEAPPPPAGGAGEMQAPMAGGQEMQAPGPEPEMIPAGGDVSGQ